MTVSNTPGALKKFGRSTWRFQTTFRTPLKELPAFVSTILAATDRMDQGTVTIDEIVFEPKNLKALLATNGAPGQLEHDWTIAAEGKADIHALLQAALADWVNFLFVPTPKPFVIYADHDEYTTFYTASKSNLNPVISGLLQNGFGQVQDYHREIRS
jgi:hypothetical protein